MTKKKLPGPVPVEGMPNHVWPTWREALVDAFESVPRAYERRRSVVQAAYDAGLTFRQIAEATGVTAAAVHKIIGNQSKEKSDGLMDEMAGVNIIELAYDPVATKPEGGLLPNSCMKIPPCKGRCNCYDLLAED